MTIRHKTTTLLAAFLCCAMTIGAQGLFKKSKMSPWLATQYQQQQEAVKENGGPLRVNGRPVRKYILTLVQNSDDAQTIREKGGVVWQDFGDGICAAFLPMDSLGVLDQAPGILRMEANECSKLQNDTSAVLIGADKAWDFENTLNAQHSTVNSSIPQAFTGKGVIAGIMDVGFDFTHPAFRNEDGTSRIQWFWDPMAENETPGELGQFYTNPTEVLAARHSSDDGEHGSHVLGSMAGDGLKGRYVGMAPEADIMGAYIPLGKSSDEFLENLRQYIVSHLEEDLANALLSIKLSDAIDLVELHRIFEQADAAGQPCVVNWSFGSPADFFDDFTLYEQVFNQMVGPGHIVVTSAGNYGDYFSYLKKEAGTPMEQDIYYSTTDDYYKLTMRTEPDEPFFDFRLKFDVLDYSISVNTKDIYDAVKEGEPGVGGIFDGIYIFATMKWGAFDKPVYKIFVEPQDELANSLRFGQYMDLHGQILIGSDAQAELMGGTTSDNYVLFSEETCTNARGCHQGTIGAPANMERIIAVGGMHHRSYFKNVAGKQETYLELGSEEGQLMSFSSCGPTMEGRIKPDVVAPGHNVISALNSFSGKVNSQNTRNRLVYRASDLGKTYGMWAISGTSMSSPIAAGIIALWLQAKPDLTPEDVMGVIERTSHQPEPEFSGTDKNVYYGWGEIDAYAGLLDILGIGTSIPELSKHQPAGMKFRLQGRTLLIDGAEEGTPIRIYTTDGKLVASTPLAGGSISLPADSPAGVYAVQVGKLGSTLIRL